MMAQGCDLVRQLQQELDAEGMVNSLVEEEVVLSEEDGRRGSNDGEDFDFEGNLDN